MEYSLHLAFCFLDALDAHIVAHEGYGQVMSNCWRNGESMPDP